jgi:hypothetical protein
LLLIARQGRMSATLRGGGPPAEELQAEAKQRGKVTQGRSERRKPDAELPRPPKGRKGKWGG